jgi:aspartyl-tRNA(Asn)/glutamyl-tRNA(Gln) amidotransferase subunit A
MGDDLCRLPLAEVAALIRARRVSAVETATACLDRAEQLQRQFNIFITIDHEGALTAARAADADAARDRWRGPLHGVPLAHKDMFYREDRVVTCGSRLRADFRPDFTSTVVGRLEAGGVVDLGGLNMSEFACNPYGLNVLRGRAKNPWNADYIAGGSSSGSAAAVAACVAYGSFGSDTGGSIRIPAAACGMVGLLPTNGRLSRYGMMPLSFSLDNAGPIARTTRDCARLLGAVAGPDPLDPNVSNVAVPDYEAALTLSVRGKRLGIPRRHYYEACSSEVMAALNRSLAVFADLGVSIIEVDVPDPKPTDALGNILILAEASTIHAAWLRTRSDEYTPLVKSRIEFGLSFTAPQYIEALRLRTPLLARFMDAVFSKVDVLHLPMLSQPVPSMAAVETQLAGNVDLSFSLASNTRSINYLGLTALTLPCGLAGNGLPIAFQLVAPPFAEARLFNFGHQYEETAGAPPLPSIE